MTEQPTGAPAAQRRFGAPKNWRKTFIAALGESSHVAAAARTAQISLSCVYRTRREDPEFKRLWFTALCEGYDNLEMDLLCWLRHGRIEPPNGGNSHDSAKGPDRKFDSASALRVLAAHRDTVGKERNRQSLEDEATIIASINVKIDAMQAREKAARRRPPASSGRKALSRATRRATHRGGA